MAALWVAAIIFVSGCSHHMAQPVGLSAGSIEIPSGSVMIVIDDPRSERRRLGAGSPAYNAPFSYARNPALHRATARIAARHELQVITHWPLQNLRVHCIVIDAPDPQTLLALEADPEIRWVQSFNEFQTQSAVAPKITAGFSRILRDLPGAAEGVTIAVVDTSIDSEHPALDGSAIVQRNFAGSAGHFNAEPHGTAVVGLLSAQPKPSSRVAGLAHAAQVRVLRACWQTSAAATGMCNTLTLALALDAAIDLSPEVLNLSLTGGPDPVLDALLEKLLARGTIVIAAFDEARPVDARFPLPHAGVVYAYGGADAPSTLNDRQQASFVMPAPRHALSLAPMAGYDLVSGHSIAAPHVSAMAARIIAARPRADRDAVLRELRQRLACEQCD
ncbi:MAG: S8 family serine peptidase [Pseudomonadota bacterium]